MGIAVIAYFPLIAFVTCGVCGYGVGSETLLSDVLKQTAELSPAPREGDVHEEACKGGNKLCSGTKHQQSSSGDGHRRRHAAGPLKTQTWPWRILLYDAD